VSCGGTGSIEYTCAVDGVTEIQASGGMFSDLLIHSGMSMPNLDWAMFVLTTVTSRPTADRVIVDAGRKSMVHWELLDMPAVVEGKYAGKLTTKVLCAEHGVLEFEQDDQNTGPKPGPQIGEKLQLVPAYHDLTTCLHEELVWVQAGKVVSRMLTDARGKLQ